MFHARVGGEGSTHFSFSFFQTHQNTLFSPLFLPDTPKSPLIFPTEWRMKAFSLPDTQKGPLTFPTFSLCYMRGWRMESPLIFPTHSSCQTRGQGMGAAPFPATRESIGWGTTPFTLIIPATREAGGMGPLISHSSSLPHARPEDGGHSFPTHSPCHARSKAGARQNRNAFVVSPSIPHGADIFLFPNESSHQSMVTYFFLNLTNECNNKYGCEKGKKKEKKADE